MKQPAFADLPDFDEVATSPFAAALPAIEALPSGPSPEEIAAEAYERGFEAGRIEALGEADVQVVQAQAAFEAELASHREMWMHEYTERLVAGLESVKAELAAVLGEQCAAILTPFVRRGFEEQALAGLSSAIARAADAGSKVTVRGSEPLLGRIREVLGARGIDANIEDSELPGISVEIDETRMRSSLDEWFEKLEAAAS